MVSRARELVAPIYLLMCLVLGGSAQAIWGNMLLQLIGLAIIAWSAVDADADPLVKPARQLLWLVVAGLAVVAVQLIPLPGSVWPGLGGRRWIAEGYRILGVDVPPMSLSLTPYKSIDALLGLIPAIAIFAAIVRLKAYRGGLLSASLLVAAVTGILLGALQVMSSAPEASPWYLYRQTNYGVAVGFFANANHMATLLLITLPFLAALAAAAKGRDAHRYRAFLTLAGAASLVLIVGVALNRSLAAYGLVLPVLVASALILLPHGSRCRKLALIGAAVLLVAGIALVATSSIGSNAFGQEATTSVQSRQEILATTSTALKDFFPFGSGLGSFREVYRLYEDPAAVGAIYVIHAHNDYAELLLETGLAGAVVLALFLLWWGAAVRRVWLSAEAGPFARAASIASAAVLAHSLVDYPLRTAAISAAFGMCLALLADRRPPQAADSSDLRPTRHFVVR